MSERPRRMQPMCKSCDFCNRCSDICDKYDDPLGRCQNCTDFDVPCTFDRRTKLRGTKHGILADDQLPGTSRPDKSAARGIISRSSVPMASNALTLALQPPVSDDPWSILHPSWPVDNNDQGTVEDIGIRHAWKAFAISVDGQIRNLVQLYFEIVYPIFPLFHRPSFIKAVDNQEYLRNQGLFASIMALCALVSGRVRDGALSEDSKRWHREDLIEPPSEVYFAAAVNSMPDQQVAAEDMNYMRACALLAITSIQNGQIKEMQKFAGIYHTRTSMDGLYDEKLWPRDLNAIEIEERRRLFWSIYTLDIYSTIVWGGVIRYREAHSLVRYPSEIDDDFITSDGYTVPSEPLGSTSFPGFFHQPVTWLRGWNFVTDLYRVLEHIIDSNRHRFPSAKIDPVLPLLGSKSMSELVVIEHVLSMYSALPPQFRETPPITGDITKDLFGFQSANIHATMQLLRMVLLSTEEAGVDRRCDVVEEMLSVFSEVPLAYLKAINLPLIHHLGGIGSILGSVMEDNLSEVSYRRVHALVLATADFLDRLEAGLHRVSGASERLRCQVNRIDNFIRTSRQMILHTVPAKPGDDTVSLGAKLGPAVPHKYAQNGSDPELKTSSALAEEMSLFQLPQELLMDWPFPLDNLSSDGFLPLVFERFGDRP